MSNLAQIYQDIETLPQAAQDLLIDFVEILKKRYLPQSNLQVSTPYEQLKEIGFIGCCSIKSDLSTTYNQHLSTSLIEKYDHL